MENTFSDGICNRLENLWLVDYISLLKCLGLWMHFCNFLEVYVCRKTQETGHGVNKQENPTREL